MAGQPRISSLFTPDPVVSPTTDQYYPVLVTNACGSVPDSAFVDVQQVFADAWPDTLVCPGEPITLFATGGLTYAWSPATALSHPDSSTTQAAPTAPTTYTVTAANALGCEGTATASVQHFPRSRERGARHRYRLWRKCPAFRLWYRQHGLVASVIPHL